MPISVRCLYVHLASLVTIFSLLAGSAARLEAQSVTLQDAHTVVVSDLKFPGGVALDSTGNIFVADTWNHRVLKVAADGSSQTLVGSGWGLPYGVAVDDAGNVYVADQVNSFVVKVPADGGVTTAVGAGLLSPVGVTVDAARNVYIADAGNNRIVKVPADGSPQMTIGAGLSNPRGVAADSAGKIYVADSGNNRVVMLAPADGFSETTVASGLSGPIGVAVRSGSVYISDSGANRVIRIAQDGTQTTVTTDVNTPAGLALDSAGRIFVADFNNNRVLKVFRDASNLGDIRIRHSSSVRNFTYTFGASTTLGSVNVVTGGQPNTESVDAGTGTCAANHTYGVGETCTVDVTFAPAYPGMRPGAILLRDDAGITLATTYIFGTGLGPAVNLDTGTTMLVAGSLDSAGSVAVDGNGSVYIVDWSNRRVLKVTSGGVQATLYGRTETWPYAEPWSVTVDGAGNLYVSDYYYRRVFKVPADGGERSIVCDALDYGRALAVDGAGNLYFADYSAGIPDYSVVVRVTPGGTRTYIYLTRWAIYAIAVNSRGDLYVACQDGVWKVPADGSAHIQVMDLVDWVNGSRIAVDAADNLYVTRYGLGRVDKITPGGVWSTVYSGPTGVWGVALDAAANLYISLYESGLVVKQDREHGPALNFGTVALGATSAASTVIFSNGGNEALNFSELSMPPNFVQQISGATDCASATQLPPAASCRVAAAFRPTVTGDVSGSILLTNNALNDSGAQQSIPVHGASYQTPATNLAFSGLPSDLIAGANPGTVIVNVRDAYGYVVSTSTALVTLTVTGPNNFNQSYTATASGGVAGFDLSALVLADMGVYTFAASSSGLTSASATVSITSPVAAQLLLAGYPSPIMGGLPQKVTVTAIDAFGNIATTFIGTVHFTSSDPAAVLPPDYTFQLTDAGIHDFTVKLITGGSHSITATSGVSASQTGIIILPGATNCGDITIGESGTTTLNYTFTTALTLGGVQVLTKGAPSLDFRRSAAPGTCTSGQSYSSGATCTIHVDFTPRYPRLRMGAVVLTDDTGNTVFQTPLSGTGLGPAITFDPGIAAQFGPDLSALGGLDVDGAGNVYLAGSPVQKVAPDGSTTPVGTGLSSPSDVAVDAAGNVFIANRGDSPRVVKVTPAGVQTVVATGLSDPIALGTSAAGDLYVCGGNDNRVVKISPAGVLTTVGSGLVGPHDVATDGAGNVYILDYAHSGVVKVNPAGAQTTVATGVANPSGLFIDGMSNIYITDLGNRAVVRVAPDGTRTTLVSSLFSPFGVAVDGAGNIYISDQFRILKVDRHAPTLNFGSAMVGQTTAAQTLTLANSGNSPLNFSALRVATNFVLQPGGGADCSASTQLLARQTCQVSAAFAPTEVGIITGSVILTDNALNQANAQQSIALNGTGVARLAFASALPATLSTGDNPGALNVNVLDGLGNIFTDSVATITLTATGPSGFTQTHDVAAVSGVSRFDLTELVLTRPGTYTVTATSAGHISASGTVVVTASLTGGTFAVSGHASPVFGGTPHTFAVTALDDYGNTVTNFAGTVHFSSSDGSANLPADYTFQASDNGTHSFLATLRTNGAQSLTATSGARVGTQSDIAVLPNSATLGEVVIGQSADTALTYTFGGAVTLGTVEVLTKGAPALDFRPGPTAGSCTAGQSYAAGDSCTVHVTFAPRYPGLRMGSVVLTDNAGTRLFDTPIYGTGHAPMISFDSGSQTQTQIGSVGYPAGVAIVRQRDTYPERGDTAEALPSVGL